MAIQTPALDVQVPRVESPLDAFSKAASVQDMLSQMTERNQRAADYAAQAPLRKVQLTNQLQSAAEKQAMDRAFAQSVKPYDPSVGDLEYDDSKAQQVFDSTDIPGVGKGSYLFPQYQAQKDAQRSIHRKQAIDELTQTNSVLANEAQPIKNFLAITDDDPDKQLAKREAAYPALKKALLPTDPSWGKILGPGYSPDLHDKIFQQTAQAHDLQEGTAQQLKDAQDRESIGKIQDDKLSIEDLWKKQGGQGAPTLQFRNAVIAKRSGVPQPPAAGQRAQFSPPLTADRLPPDATDLQGNQIEDRDSKNQYIAVMHGGEVLGYQPYQPKTMATTSATLAEKAAGGDKTAQAALDKLQRPTTASLAVQAANGDPIAKAALKLFPAQAGAAAGGLTDDAITMAAKKYAAGAPLDSLGMGSAAVGEKTKILNKAAELSKGTDIATQVALYKSNSSALTQLQKNAASVNAFENTALANIGVLQNSMKSIVDSGSPLINKPLRDIDEKGLGSPEVAAFKAARQIATTEIAKVLNNPTSGTALSDSARREAQSLIGEGATMAQVYKIVNTLKQDMVNRRKGFQDEIDARTKAIQNLSPVAHDAAQPEALTPAPPAGKIIKYDAHGNRIGQ